MDLTRRKALGAIAALVSLPMPSWSQDSQNYPHYPLDQWGAGWLYIAGTGAQSSQVNALLDRIEWPAIPTGTNARKEIDSMLEYQAIREANPDLTDAIKADYEDPLSLILKKTLGDEDSTVARVVVQAYLDASVKYIMAAKLRFSRQRADVIEQRIKPCVSVCSFPTYPSGHVAQAHMTAEILSKMYPEHANKAREYAAQVDLNGEYAGSHFPSDGAAGRALAKALEPEIRRTLGSISAVTAVVS